MYGSLLSEIFVELRVVKKEEAAAAAGDVAEEPAASAEEEPAEEEPVPAEGVLDVYDVDQKFTCSCMQLSAARIEASKHLAGLRHQLCTLCVSQSLSQGSQSQSVRVQMSNRVSLECQTNSM